MTSLAIFSWPELVIRVAEGHIAKGMHQSTDSPDGPLPPHSLPELLLQVNSHLKEHFFTFWHVLRTLLM